MFRFGVPSEDLLYRPIKKRKRRNPKANAEKTYKLHLAKDELKQYHIGDICIGETDNILTNNDSDECTASFKSTNLQDNLILRYDNITILVKLAFDVNFIKDVFISKVICCNFLIIDEKVYLKIYFMSLPITNTVKSCKLLKSIFHLIHDVRIVEDDNVKTKSLAEPEDVLFFYNSLKAKHVDCSVVKDDLQHSYLKPTLHPYQIEAVRWMISRESVSDQKILNPLFEAIELPSSTVVYYNKYCGILESEEPLINSIRSGGILADEMGLGKTVELLACILNNPLTQFDVDDRNTKMTIEYVPRKRKLAPTIDGVYACSSKKLKEHIVKSNYMLLSDWYNEVLESTKTKKSKKRSVACVCGNTGTRNVIKCSNCEILQHGSCVGYQQDFGDFICTKCWLKMDNIPCKGSLIVCPVSLRTQWVNEVEKHVEGNFSVLVYEGIAHCPIYPVALKNYDLIITTYNILQQELRLTENVEARNLRNPPKYSQGCSPIVNMKWWRLCLDETQVIENRAMVTEMSKRIDAVHRWAVTGTPISKNINDIHTLIDYLVIEPYSDKFCWDQLLYKPYLNGNFEPMFNFLSGIMWRTCKKDVLDQINIPVQRVEEHWLEFTETERYFYSREHDIRYCDFIRKLTNFDHDTPLKTLDNKNFKEMWTPFLALRQACVHHNAVKGKYLRTRKVVSSMNELLDALIEKNVQENEEHLRVCISTLNGLAGIQLLLQHPSEAVEEYLKVMKLIEIYNEKKEPVFLNVDSLQIIHVLHNLSEILTNFPQIDVNNLALTYKRQCLDYENKYVDKHGAILRKLQGDLLTEADGILEIENQFIHKQHVWYADALNYIIRNGLWNDYFTKFNNKVPGDTSKEAEEFMNGSKNLLYNLARWDDDLMKLRKTLLKKFDSLWEMDESNQLSIPSKIVMEAMDCHLRPIKTDKNKQKKECKLCVSQDILAKYEVKLFRMKENKKEANVGVYITSLEEISIKSIFNVIKSKNDESIIDVITDGTNFMKLLDAIKNEFKILSKLYLYVDTEISSKDEINMCKMRFSLKETSPDSTPADKRVQSILKKLEMDISQKNNNEIAENELDYQKTVLHNQELQQMQNLERNLGTYGYLNTLKKQHDTSQQRDPCPICTYPLQENWNMLKCGHSFCAECIEQLLKGHGNEKYITCSVCRQRQLIQDISLVNLNAKNRKSEFLGNISTKFEGVIRLILRLRNEDVNVKILIFSTWYNILNILHGVLGANGISSELIRNQYMDKQMKNFKDGDKATTALLMPINFGGKGLNIIEASHVIFLEALVDAGQELQAIGRVHRIGQIKETTVHKFIIRGTIEEKIYNAVVSNGDKWNQNTMKLGQIVDLFSSSQAG